MIGAKATYGAQPETVLADADYAMNGIWPNREASTD